MIVFDEVHLNSCILHRVGNKAVGEALKLSSDELSLPDDYQLNLNQYFLKPFKGSAELYQFKHDIDLKMNEIFSICNSIFEREDFVKASQNIAKHMFTQTRHPAIKSGEVFVALLDDVKFDNIICQAVGIFKSERKENFFKVDDSHKSMSLIMDQGISPQKLDKGCIILNSAYHEGFKVLTYEHKGADTDYWRDDFLSIEPKQDNYFQTKNFLNVCKEFVTEALPSEFEITKADQIDYLKRSVDYFKSNEDFNTEKFVKEVFQEPGIMKSFNKFKSNQQDGGDLSFSDEFNISNQAVKHQAKHFKEVIKLDSNFHLYIHGDNNMIEQGYDKEKGLNFYKIYYKEER